MGNFKRRMTGPLTRTRPSLTPTACRLSLRACASGGRSSRSALKFWTLAHGLRRSSGRKRRRKSCWSGTPDRRSSWKRPKSAIGQRRRPWGPRWTRATREQSGSVWRTSATSTPKLASRRRTCPVCGLSSSPSNSCPLCTDPALDTERSQSRCGCPQPAASPAHGRLYSTSIDFTPSEQKRTKTCAKNFITDLFFYFAGPNPKCPILTLGCVWCWHFLKTMHPPSMAPSLSWYEVLSVVCACAYMACMYVNVYGLYIQKQ